MPVKPYKNPVGRVWLKIAGTVGIVALIASVSLKIEATIAPPMVNHDIRLVNPIVKAEASELVIEFTTERRRLCRSRIERIIVDSRNQTVWTGAQEGIGQAVGPPASRRVVVKLPASLRHGAYTYRSILFSDCGPGDQHALLTPDLHFFYEI